MSCRSTTDKLKGADAGWHLVGAVSSAMAIAGSLIAAKVITSGAAIGGTLIVAGVGAYFAGKAVESLVNPNRDAVMGGAIDGVTAAFNAAPGDASVDGGAAKSFFVGGAKTSGDPHLDTFDGRAYDFQAAGEFVLARSVADPDRGEVSCATAGPLPELPTSGAFLVPGDAAYIVSTNLFVDIPMTVEAGAVLCMKENVADDVSGGGSLTLNGTSEAPVRIQGDAQSPAFRRGIRIASASVDNRFEHAEISDAGGTAQTSVFPANIALDGSGKLELRNSTVRDSAGLGAYVEDGAVFAAVGANRFSGNGDAALRIAPMHMASLDGSGQYLGGNGIDAVYVVGGTANANGTWAALDAPYWLEGIANVDAEITISAGASFRLNSGGGSNVQGGALAAVGNATAPAGASARRAPSMKVVTVTPTMRAAM